jgi:tetratricopeptide (TPR) repeat protein
MSPACGCRSRALIVASTAVALALGAAAPGARAASPGQALVAPDQPAVDRTIDQLMATTRRAGRDPAAFTALGDAFMQKARETADASYYGRAEQAFERARALDATDVGATLGLAWVQSARHEFEKSTEWATRALALDPKNAAAYGLLGDAAMELGDYDLAAEHYQKMLDLRPDISAYSRSAHFLFVTGDVRRATWLMDKAIKAGAAYAENAAWCRAQLALMHLATGNLVAAEQIIEEAIARTPGNYHVLFAQGRARAARANYAGAVASYRRASAIAPQHEVVVALGQLYTVTGDRKSAEQQWALVETLDTLNKANGVEGDVQIARFLADLDRRLPEALTIAERAYERRPNVFVADTLAWTYYKTGRYAAAQRMILKALAHRTPDASMFFHAGMIYAKLGDRATAQRHLAHALTLNPAFSPIDAPIAAATLAELGTEDPDAPRP